MRHVHILSVMAVVFLLALGACTGPKGVLKLHQHNNGDLINLQVGETMEVILNGDPGTNIHRTMPPGDPDILEQIGEAEYFLDIESPDAGQRLKLRFRATAPGKTRLQLSYRNPQFTNATQERQFEVRVEVKEPRKQGL